MTNQTQPQADQACQEFEKKLADLEQKCQSQQMQSAAPGQQAPAAIDPATVLAIVSMLRDLYKLFKNRK